MIEWFADSDGDGFGDPATSMLRCAQPDGFVDNADDCDDSTVDAQPGGTEVLCDGLDNDCDAVTTDDCASGCEPFVSAVGAYALCVEVTTRSLAGVACDAMNMSLMQIDDSAENDAVQAEMDSRFGSAQYFVGGQDAVEGAWRWPDGTQFWAGAANGAPVGGAFESWNAGEPNNANGVEDCMEVSGAGGWNDVPCTDLRRFVCERP